MVSLIFIAAGLPWKAQGPLQTSKLNRCRSKLPLIRICRRLQTGSRPFREETVIAPTSIFLFAALMSGRMQQRSLGYVRVPYITGSAYRCGLLPASYTTAPSSCLLHSESSQRARRCVVDVRNPHLPHVSLSIYPVTWRRMISTPAPRIRLRVNVVLL